MKIFILILISSSLSFAECISPDGPPLMTGDSVTLFTTKYKPENKDCVFSNRECQENGVLSGNPDAIFAECLDEKTCEHPFLPEPLNDQETVVVYKNPGAPCIKETRVCDGKTGVLSGSFLNDFCKENKK